VVGSDAGGRRCVVFRGPFVRYPEAREVAMSSRRGVVCVDTQSGRIVACGDEGEAGFEALSRWAQGAARVVSLSGSEFLMPGLVDAHAHAPQHAFAGTGLDLPLLEWLQTYTFPHEAKFGDVAYARRVYEGVVRRHLRSGTTTASYFGTIHVEGTLELVAACEALGQRAHVGKVCMDANAPEYYVEKDAATSAAAAARFVEAVEARRSPLVEASVVPRFAPSCSAELLAALGRLASSRCLPVHTHLSENRQEVDWVASLFPEAKCYADVYRRAGLLGDRAYFAHCCYCDTLERGILADANAGVVHCPTSNFMVGRHMADVRAWIDRGVKVGLGTDVAAGWSTSMLDAARHAVVTSRLVAEREADPRKALSWREVLYLATKGGADVLGLDAGALAPGRLFDALVVDAALLDGPLDVFDPAAPAVLLEKFFWNGDDRNVRDVFVSGVRVAGARESPADAPRANRWRLAALAAALLAAVLFARR